MSLAESACYTLINVPDTEPYNEMQIKLDLGELDNIFSISRAKMTIFCFHREGRNRSENRYTEESHPADAQWRATSQSSNDDNSICSATAKSHNQEIVVDLLGNCTEGVGRWKTSSRDDSRLRCLSQGLATSQ